MPWGRRWPWWRELEGRSLQGRAGSCLSCSLRYFKIDYENKKLIFNLYLQHAQIDRGKTLGRGL
jgi:hypothetical protein